VGLDGLLRNGLVARMFGYYGEAAHSDLLRQLGVGG